ncbi:hypothetical protein ES708_15746 [subsurface metagenome]
MPEYRCQSCGVVWYGWGSKGICQKCGGKLEPFNGTAKKKESEGDKGR